jgi:uncharacterized protein YciI
MTPIQKIIFPMLALLAGIGSCKQPAPGKTSADQTGYDSVLAARLHSDGYGMRRYVMALLKAGPNRGQDSAEASRLLRLHLKNIDRLADEGKLCVAGPFLDDGELQGIYIFNVETVDEANALVASDPSVQAGRLQFEMHPWYGSAALQLVPEDHKKIQKSNIME